MSGKKKVAVFLFDNVEECEALIVVDLLRRADIIVDTVSIKQGLEVSGSHNIRIQADKLLDDMDLNDYEMLILPGGPGVVSYRSNEKLTEMLQLQDNRNGLIGAICAAPFILAELGILAEKPATSYPSVRDSLIDNGVIYVDSPVIIADNIITGKALGAAIPFAAAIIGRLLSQEEADKVLSMIYYS